MDEYRKLQKISLLEKIPQVEVNAEVYGLCRDEAALPPSSEQDRANKQLCSIQTKWGTSPNDLETS